jgi:Tfp pilus assembly protein PilO
MIVERSEKLLAGRERWDERLGALREKLPRFAPDTEATAELLRQLEHMARKHGLTLLKAMPEEEEQGGELFSIAIHYTWEGELEALVRFLYSLQTDVRNMDIRRLNISPLSREEQLLKGGFTVDAAFTREKKDSA